MSSKNESSGTGLPLVGGWAPAVPAMRITAAARAGKDTILMEAPFMAFDDIVLNTTLMGFRLQPGPERVCEASLGSVTSHASPSTPPAPTP